MAMTEKELVSLTLEDMAMLQEYELRQGTSMAAADAAEQLEQQVDEESPPPGLREKKEPSPEQVQR